MKTMNKFELLAYARDAVKVKLDESLKEAAEFEEAGVTDSWPHYFAKKYQAQYDEILELLTDALFHPED